MCNRSGRRRRIVLLLEWAPMAIWLGMALALVVA
jgi:hypothetical protein